MLTAPTIEVMLYSHDYGQLDLTPAVVNVSTSKNLGSEGHWSVSFRDDVLHRARGFADASAAEDKRSGLSSSRPRIMDDDWVSIAVNGRAIMLGMVDGLRRTRTATDGGSVVTEHVLTGRDFQKAFMSSELAAAPFFFRIDPPVPGTFPLSKITAAIETFIKGAQGPPHDTLLHILKVALINDVNKEVFWWQLPAGLRGTDLARALHFSANVTHGRVFLRSGYQPKGRVPMDTFLRSPMVTPFTEWFYDLRAENDEYPQPLQGIREADTVVDPVRRSPYVTPISNRWPEVPTLVYRDHPFDSNDWFKLPLHTVLLNETISDDLGTSGAERYTAFSVTTKWWSDQRQAGLYQDSKGRIPIMEYDGNAVDDSGAGSEVFASGVTGEGGATASSRANNEFGHAIERHGLRWLEVHNQHATPDKGTHTKTQLEQVVEQTERLYRWYSDLPEYLSGSVQLAHIRPEIRIGERVQYDGRQYYIQGVRHTLGVNDTGGQVDGSTSLILSRGHDPYAHFPANPIPWKPKQ